MLIDIPSEEIPNFIRVLEKENPRSFFIINFIETCHKWKRINNQLLISLLYTKQSMETGVFVGVLKSGCVGTLVSMYALRNHLSDLEKALKHVPIEWKTVVFFEGIVDEHFPIVENLIRDNCLENNKTTNIFLMSMAKEDALRLEIEYPEDVSLAPLTESHAEEMYNNWVLKSYFTIDALKYDIRYNDEAAYGVFCKKTGDLLASCVRAHSGVLTALQTAEKARNKGYAKLLIKHIAKKMAERGVVSCAYTKDLNLASLHTFHSSGYKDVYRLRNYFCKKK